MKRIIPILIAMATMVSCNPRPQSAQEQVVNNILTRVSVRQFTGERPSDEQVQTLLRCAMAAPSAVNRQPWAFIVVDDPALLKQIGDSLPNTRVQNNAQLCFVMCGDLNKTMEGEAQEYWIHDVSACTENLLLAAHSMGLGAVWCAIQPNAERIRLARQILNIPDNLIPLCIVPVGYPAEQPAVKDKWKEENVFYNRF